MSSPSLAALLLSVLATLCATCGAQPDGPQSPQRPNILFIVTDQQRYDAIGRVQNELSAYNGKLKIRTPNLDRLSREGAYIRTAYSQCPVCGPARTSMRTGCTIERTGVQTNPLEDDVNSRNPRLFQNKIDQLQGLDQILVEDYGYVSEYYGKWHLPSRLYYHRNGSSQAVDFNDYDYESGNFTFNDVSWEKILENYLDHFLKLGLINQTFEPGQQEDVYSHFPYTPITSLDSRYGLPTNSPLDESDSFLASQSSLMGNFSLSKQFSASFLNHDVALRALNRLATQSQPFLLTVSYHHPHPPYMAQPEYLSYYWDRRNELFASPTVAVPLNKSTSYFAFNEQRKLQEAGYCNFTKIKEWTAIYYALVEEIDTLVGIMLGRIDELGIANNTLVVFTSDHGEMLGSHCLRGKSTFFEESVRVPLFIKLPGVIPAETIVEEPISGIDVFSTILDYSSASASDNSDGLSIRPFIEGRLYNLLFDETVAISEWDNREPEDEDSLSSKLDKEPNFMIRRGEFKLLMHKKSDSEKSDMLFNLANDPFELHNLIGPDRAVPDMLTIGKAEHMRYLLLDWMSRVQLAGRNDFYSDPVYNVNEGLGDMHEILNRQSWPASDLWVGDRRIVFKKAAPLWSTYVRNEWLYIGRRNPGNLSCSIQLAGNDAYLFRIDHTAVDLNYTGFARIKVTLEFDIAAQLPDPVDAFILVQPIGNYSIRVDLSLQLTLPSGVTVAPFVGTTSQPSHFPPHQTQQPLMNSHTIAPSPPATHQPSMNSQTGAPFPPATHQPSMNSQAGAPSPPAMHQPSLSTPSITAEPYPTHSPGAFTEFPTESQLPSHVAFGPQMLLPKSNAPSWNALWPLWPFVLSMLFSS